MNKETRIFIWGLLLLLICAVSLSSQLSEYEYNEEFSLSDKLLLLGNILGIISGGIKIIKTT